MSWAGELFFVFCAVLAIGAAVGTAIAVKPLRAAVALLFHILALAGLYLTLRAHLLAALQLLVYAGAVVVLFVFVIMLIGPSTDTMLPERRGRGVGVRAASLCAMVILTAGLSFTLIDYQGASRRQVPPDFETRFGTVEGLGNALYRDALIPFEALSILLLVAVVGALTVARTRQQRRSGSPEAPNPSSRQGNSWA